MMTKERRPTQLGMHVFACMSQMQERSAKNKELMRSHFNGPIFHMAGCLLLTGENPSKHQKTKTGGGLLSHCYCCRCCRCCRCCGLSFGLSPSHRRKRGTMKRREGEPWKFTLYSDHIQGDHSWMEKGFWKFQLFYTL